MADKFPVENVTVPPRTERPGAGEAAGSLPEEQARVSDAAKQQAGATETTAALSDKPALTIDRAALLRAKKARIAKRIEEKANKGAERLAHGTQAGAGGQTDRLKLVIARLSQELAELKSSYYLSGAHKKIDLHDVPPFGDIAGQIQEEGRAGMGLDRMYTLWQAVASAPDGPSIEVGAYKGGSARLIAESIRHAGRSSRFYVCDTFQGHAHTDALLDTQHRDGTKFRDTSADEVRQYLSDYGNVQVVPGDIHVTATQLAQVPAWGFVHVDVDVHNTTDFCLRFFAPRLLPGAWLVVDDYGFTTCPGAKKAVDDFIAEQTDFRMLHLLTGQALILKSR